MHPGQITCTKTFKEKNQRIENSGRIYSYIVNQNI